MNTEITINTLHVDFLVECYTSHDAKKQAFYKEAVRDNAILALRINQIYQDQKVIKNLNKELYKTRKNAAERKVKALAEIVTNSKCASACDHANAIWTTSPYRNGNFRLMEDGFCPTCLNRITKIKRAF